jgi:hypothetical protein
MYNDFIASTTMRYLTKDLKMLTFTLIHNGSQTFTATASSFAEVRSLKTGTKDEALELVIYPIRAGNKPSKKRILAYIAQTNFLSLMEGADHNRGVLHISSQKVPQGIMMSCSTTVSSRI